MVSPPPFWTCGRSTITSTYAARRTT